MNINEKNYYFFLQFSPLRASASGRGGAMDFDLTMEIGYRGFLKIRIFGHNVT